MRLGNARWRARLVCGAAGVRQRGIFEVVVRTEGGSSSGSTGDKSSCAGPSIAAVSPHTAFSVELVSPLCKLSIGPSANCTERGNGGSRLQQYLGAQAVPARGELACVSRPILRPLLATVGARQRRHAADRLPDASARCFLCHACFAVWRVDLSSTLSALIQARSGQDWPPRRRPFKRAAPPQTLRRP
jgi:hypothetical protein